MVLLSPWVALAQATTSEKAAAEALFDEGLQLLRQDKLQAACERFEKSQGIDPAVGTLLYLAECYERTGRTASAWATFREAASSAFALGQSERAQVGTQRAKYLEPKLSRVVLDVGDNATLNELRVERDGEVVARALFGEPIPLDPGEHRVVASAPGYETLTQTFNVAAESAVQTLTLPPLVPTPVAAAEPELTVERAEPSFTPPQDKPAPAAETDRTWTWVAGGVGVAGVAVGVVFGLRATSLDEEAEASCSGTRCADLNGEEKNEQARTSALVANIGYGVGIAGLGTALVLALLDVGGEETAGQRIGVASSTAGPLQSAQQRAVARRATNDSHFRWTLQPEVTERGTSIHLLGQF
jgi:hypothetical protein